MSSPEADHPRGIRPRGIRPRGVTPRAVAPLEARDAVEVESRRPIRSGVPERPPAVTGGIRPPRTSPAG